MANRKRIFISTGEVSGDLHGALLIQALKRNAPALDLELEIMALGGDRMTATGCQNAGTNPIDWFGRGIGIGAVYLADL